MVYPVHFGNPFEALKSGLMLPGELKNQDLINALNEYKRQEAQAESKYYPDFAKSKYEVAKLAPLTAQSEAASKLAYANLMGPQFISKLMQNPDLLANIPEDQKGNFLKLITQAGTNQSNPNNFSNPHISNILRKPDISDLPVEQQSTINNMKPGESFVVPDNKTFAERSGEYAGTKKELEEAGKYRAKDIQYFGEKLESSQRLSDKFNQLTNMIGNPVFRNMRSDMPFFQAEQMYLKSKTGTPEEQELVGTFKNTADEFVRDTINSFEGTKLKGELEVAKNMKVSDNDSFNVIVGKVRSAMTYKELNSQRIKIASALIRDEHLTKVEALEKADKLLNTKEIMSDINKKLDYPIQVRNKKTGAIETIPVSEARKRKIPNV